MKLLSNLIALEFATAAISVAPHPGVKNRQAGVVYVRFYAQSGCQGNWIEDTVYFDDGTDACQVETLSIPYASWRVEQNDATRMLSAYSGDDCTSPDGRNVIPLLPRHVQCYTQNIGSTQFGP